MDEKRIETHPFEPFLPENAKILLLGSFPPARNRWSMDFYYPNFQNDMWRILGLIFGNDKNYFVLPGQKMFDKERIISFLNEYGIALGDTARCVIRHKDNASDKFLEIVTPADIGGCLSRLPLCAAITTTGQKATDTLSEILCAAPPKVGEYTLFCYGDREMRFYRMPSSSRAYPKPVEEKARIYRQMFTETGVI